MNFFLECKPDEALVKVLGIASQDIKHSNDKGRVCKRLQESRRMKAMIDDDSNDEKQPSYRKELLEVSRVYGVLHLVDSSREHIVIALCPKLEDWFLNACKSYKSYKVDVRQFNLPNTPSELHEMINFRLANFERAIQHLVEIGNPAILHLQALVLQEPR